MKRIRKNTFEYLPFSALQKFKNVSCLRDVLRQREKENVFSDETLCVSKKIIDIKNLYQFSCLYNLFFAAFNSFSDNSPVLVIFNQLNSSLDLINLAEPTQTSQISITGEVSQVRHFLSKEKIDFILASNTNYEIYIYKYSNFSLLLAFRIPSSSFNKLASFAPLELNDHSYILRFNGNKSKVELLNFSAEKKASSSCQSQMNMLSCVDKNHFFTWFNNGISTYVIDEKLMKIKNVTNISSFNKMTSNVSFYSNGQTKEKKLLELNRNYLNVWDFFRGSKEFSIAITVYESLTNIVKWNDNVFYILTETGKLMKYNYLEETKEQTELKFENVFQTAVVKVGVPSVFCLESNGETFLLSNR